MKEHTLKSGMIWNALGNAIYLACQWLITILVANIGNFEDAGLLSIAMSVSATFQTFALFGIRNYQVSDINEKYSDGTYVSFRIITCALALSCCVIFSFISGYTSEVILCIVFFMLFRLAENFSDVLHGILQKNGRLDIVGKSFVIKGAGILALFLVGYSLTSYLWVGLLLMSSFSILSTVFFDIFITRKIKRFSLNKRLKDSFSLAKETLPLCLYLFLSAAIATVPKLLLERHSGEEILGIYSSIFAPAILIQAALGYIYTPFTPALSEYRMKSQTKKFIVLALKITAAICIFTVVMIGFASIFGEFALSLLFGDEIRPYSYLLLPILIAISAISILAFLCMIAIVLRSIPSLIIGTAIGFASTLIITVPMINKFGVNGTSYSLIVSALIASAVLVISIVFKLYTEVKKTPKIQERD